MRELHPCRGLVLNFVKGDATSPKADGAKIVIHCCNDAGGWGRGFVLAVSKRWKLPEDAYRQWSRVREAAAVDANYANCVITTGPFRLGQVQFVRVEKKVYIANIIGQSGTAWVGGVPPIRYEAIQEGLGRVATWAKMNDASVHMPRMGAGLAGGEWHRIEEIVRGSLCDQGIRVTVYDL